MRFVADCRVVSGVPRVLFIMVDTFLYDLTDLVHSYRLGEVLKIAPAECAPITASILGSLLNVLRDLHQQNPGVFVSWITVTDGTALQTDLFKDAVLCQGDLTAWMEALGLHFYRRGAARKIKVDEAYRGFTMDMLSAIVNHIGRYISRKALRNAPSPENAAVPAEQVHESERQCGREHDDQEPTSTPSTRDVSCQCNVPCAQCDDAAKKRKCLLQKIRRYKTRNEALQKSVNDK